MPAARGVKRAASKSSAPAASTGPKNKKKRGAVQLEIPEAPKKRGSVLTCGQGDVGQLGLGEDVVETTKFKHVTALGNKIVAVCAGGMHTMALDSSGKVWTFGCNDEGALGRATAADSEEGTPARVALPSPAVALSAGDSHSAALLHNGDVYAWGSFRDSHGSMGLVVRGREGKPCRDPVRLELGEPAAGLASGGDHLVVLTSSGSVFTMGCGEQGQLGRLSQRSASRDARQGFSALLVPSKVTLKAGASRVWAGYHATFALDASQERLFAWGLNNYGQLGITGEKRKTALFSPTECDAFNAVEGTWLSVAAGQHHTLALHSTGQVYAVGRCEYGRLGLGSVPGDAEAPQPVPALQDKRTVCVSAGTCNSFAVTDNGLVFAWGMGSEGQLGTGARADCPAPAAAALPAWPATRTPRALAAGGQHAVLLLEEPQGEKEPTPEPEAEPNEEELTEENDEVWEEGKADEVAEPKGDEKRKRQQGEGEVSSTSATPEDVAREDKPQKVNGDKNKDTPMEVDETDNSQDKKTDEGNADKQKDPDTDMKPEAPRPETDTSSQDSDKSQDTDDKLPHTDDKLPHTDDKPQHTDDKLPHTDDKLPHSEPSNKQDSADVEMEKTELNGAPEPPAQKEDAIQLTSSA